MVIRWFSDFLCAFQTFDDACRYSTRKGVQEIEMTAVPTSWVVMRHGTLLDAARWLVECHLTLRTED
jgi:hypothetical protein